VRHILLTICFGAVLVSPVLAQSEAVQLRYRPNPGVGILYQIKLAALLDFPLGKGAPVSGTMQFCLAPSRRADQSDDHDVVICVREGDFQLQGQKWNFTDQALSWTWIFSPLRQVRKAEGEAPKGLIGILQLFFDFVFSTEFPGSAVPVGETWQTSKLVQNPEGGSVTLEGKHRLLGIEDTPEHGKVADIESTIEIPVDATFLGGKFHGVFSGTEKVRFTVSDGEVLSMHVDGGAMLEEASGLKLTLREIDLEVERVGTTTTATVQDWVTNAERNPQLSGNSVTDAVLNANVVKYLRDNWTFYYPRAGYATGDGFLLGAGVVARRKGEYLFETNAYLGTDSLRGAYSFALTRGFPVRPTNQQYFNIMTTSASRLARVGATHFQGRRLGATGIPRMRYSAALTYNQLLQHTDYFRTTGDANYLTLSATRFRSGGSLVPRHHLDWQASASVALGSRMVGSDYDFTFGDMTWIGGVRLSQKDSVAARMRYTFGVGRVPDQFRTALVDREILRGYDLTTAPLVRNALTASVEYRTHLGKARITDSIGMTDWWGAFFVDAGIGGNTTRELLRSPAYVDLGFTIRVGIQYQSVPVYGYFSLAWPIVEGRSDPRLSFGADWAF
jgi:hypothetical protein